MKTETIRLWKDPSITSDLVRLVPDNDVPPRPALLIIPGGAYGAVCDDHEGYQIAERFRQLGFNPFILHYRILEECSPENTFADALRAIKLIRANATAWKIITDNLAVLGFSAGGHLACATGCFHDKYSANNGDNADLESAHPDAIILCYPVICMGNRHEHAGTSYNLTHSDNPAEGARYSLEKHVTENNPPAFVWCTANDQAVNMQNSLAFAEAMRINAPKVPCALHVFPNGEHGLGLAKGLPDVEQWPQMATDFLKQFCSFKISQND